MCRSTNRSRPGGPEIWFRIVHAAVSGQNGSNLAAYLEQEVKVAFGPMGILEGCDVGTLTRRMEANLIMSVVPLIRDNLNPLTATKIPRVTELLRKAVEWRRQLDASEVRNRAEIARREGITRARVTQIMGMLRLAPEIQQHILSMPEITRHPAVTERMLRAVESLTDRSEQVLQYRNFLA